LLTLALCPAAASEAAPTVVELTLVVVGASCGVKLGDEWLPITWLR
jgi:hypothetical protein